MPINLRFRTAALAFIAIAGGCSPAHDAGNDPPSPANAAGASSFLAGPADTATRADAAFLHEAVQGNERELAMVALARRRGSDAIGGLAGTLQRDHATLQRALAPLAGGVPASPVPMPAELEHLDGEQFDARFLTLLRDQHSLSVSKFEMAAGDAALSDGVRKLASAALPALRRNLERIEALRKPGSVALARNFRPRDVAPHDGRPDGPSRPGKGSEPRAARPLAADMEPEEGGGP